jgi:HlyD family secretion protein
MFQTRKKWSWIAVAVFVVIIGSGGYYYYGQRQSAVQAQQTSTQLKTSQARVGDLVVSATGSGTLVATKQASLLFVDQGLLTEVNVQVGAQVKAGDVLARVNDASARQALVGAQLQLAKAQSDLDTARESYQKLLAGASKADLLDAQAAVKTAEEKLADLKAGAKAAEISSAEAALATAQDVYTKLINGPDAEELAKAQMNLDKAKNSLWATQNSRDEACSRGGSSGCDGAKAAVLNAEIAVQQAQMDLDDLKKPATATDLKTAKAKVDQAQQTSNNLRTGATPAEIASAEAQLAKAQATLDDVQPTTSQISASKAQVQQAELTLEQAQRALEAAQSSVEDTVLTAPFTGTVMAVTAQAGERIGSDALITLADMSKPTIEIYVDEADMDKVAVGYDVEIKFDALPDKTFKGQVTQVDPELTTVSNTKVLHVLATLDTTSSTTTQSLLLGMSASVDVIGGRATNAVLVPVEALREIDSGVYGVFVVENGQPKLRVVEVGIQDMTYAEIRSGLKAGETVSTGLVETKS